jgi:transcriptional regulator with XRE-family HTH domain
MAPGRKDRDALAWFADELRAHRNAQGWTQADVAAKTSYSESLIAQVETGRKAPTPELARALDRVFATPGFTEDDPGIPSSSGTFGRLVVRLRNLPFPASFRSFAPHEAEATVCASTTSNATRTPSTVCSPNIGSTPRSRRNLATRHAMLP